jgi:hypothetical protein
MQEDRDNSHKVTKAPQQPNEGEGSRTGARQYDEAARRFIKSGKVEEKAREAEKAIDSAEGEELAAAEDVGRSHAKGEDPQLKR